MQVDGRRVRGLRLAVQRNRGGGQVAAGVRGEECDQFRDIARVPGSAIVRVRRPGSKLVAKWLPRRRGRGSHRCPYFR